MNENSVCPIWGTLASVQPQKEKETDEYFVNSSRAGGKYLITGLLAEGLECKDKRFKARLTSWLVEQRRLGVQCPEITEATIENMERRRNLIAHERADRLLQGIQKATPRIGEPLDVFVDVNAVFAVSESTDESEVEFLLQYLVRKDWLEKYGMEYRILTVEGYARLAELEKVATDSSQAFVAMWFDDSMNDVYENGIKPGIEDVGYKALRIDKEEYLDKIDDKIIAEIRRSRFLVADFTHTDIETCQNEEERKKAGARGSVYYEAGFADGLNIPVIYTCRANLIEKVHFDTRQYPHIPWEEGKLEEFSKALADRIAAVIGDGPNKTQDAG